MIPEISLQLYSLHEEATADYEGTIRAIAEIGFGNVEPAGYPGFSAAKAAALFRELGLKAPSCHGELPIGEQKHQVIDEALMLGHKAIITGAPPRFMEHYKSADTVKALADLYCEAAEVAAEHDIQVGYHNHDFELHDIDGVPGYRYFLDNTPESVLWEADLFWVARAGYDPAEFVQEIGPRGKLLHFKDGIVEEAGEFTAVKTEEGRIMVSDSCPFLPAGAGQMDLPGVAKVAKHTTYVVVELDSYEGDMMRAVQESYAYLTAAGIARGLK